MPYLPTTRRSRLLLFGFPLASSSASLSFFSTASPPLSRRCIIPSCGRCPITSRCANAPATNGIQQQQKQFAIFSSNHCCVRCQIIPLRSRCSRMLSLLLRFLMRRLPPSAYQAAAALRFIPSCDRRPSAIPISGTGCYCCLVLCSGGCSWPSRAGGGSVAAPRPAGSCRRTPPPGRRRMLRRNLFRRRRGIPSSSRPAAILIPRAEADAPAQCRPAVRQRQERHRVISSASRRRRWHRGIHVWAHARPFSPSRGTRAAPRRSSGRARRRRSSPRETEEPRQRAPTTSAIRAEKSAFDPAPPGRNVHPGPPFAGRMRKIRHPP